MKDVKKIILGTVIAIVLIALAIFFVVGFFIPEPSSDQPTVDTYKVYKEVNIATKVFIEGDPEATEVRGDKKLVMEVKNEPGFLVSIADPPRGKQPKTHPFLSIPYYDPLEADTLREVLEKAKSFEEFLALLRESGYVLEKVLQPKSQKSSAIF